MDKEIMNLIPPIIGLGNDWTPFEQEMKKDLKDRINRNIHCPYL